MKYLLAGFILITLIKIHAQTENVDLIENRTLVADKYLKQSKIDSVFNNYNIALHLAKND